MVVGCSCILVNKDGKILMQLRDEKEGILYPGYWNLFGGHLDEDEEPKACIVREIKEELEMDINPKFLTMASYIKKDDDCVFVENIDIEEKNLIVNEGQMGKFFTYEEILNLKPIVLGHLEAIKFYQSKVSNSF